MLHPVAGHWREAMQLQLLVADFIVAVAHAVEVASGGAAVLEDRPLAQSASRLMRNHQLIARPPQQSHYGKGDCGTGTCDAMSGRRSRCGHGSPPGVCISSTR